MKDKITYPHPVLRPCNVVEGQKPFIHPKLLSPDESLIKGCYHGHVCTPCGFVGYGLTAYMCHIIVLEDSVWIQGEFFKDQEVNPSLLRLRDKPLIDRLADKYVTETEYLNGSYSLETMSLMRKEFGKEATEQAIQRAIERKSRS